MLPESIRSPGRRSAYFTLLEILVIISIILILAAILGPILKRARIYAKDTLCISNLRQIGFGIKNYLHEYDNSWPLVMYWIDDFSPYAPYIKNINVLRCPGREQLAGMYDSSNTLRMTDYIRNGTMSDNELNYNYNNGQGNNPYHFDPSNEGNPTKAVVKAKTNNRRAIIERQHSNHFPKRFNIMYLDTFNYEQNITGMREFWTLEDRGWIDTSLDPWPTFDTTGSGGSSGGGSSGGGSSGGGGGGGGGKK